MSIKERVAKLEAKLAPARVDNTQVALQTDIRYVFDTVGHCKIMQFALDDEAGKLSPDDRELMERIDEKSPALQKEGGIMWLCRVLLKI